MYVLDENVLLVANNRGVTLSPTCVLACVDFLLSCQSSESVVLDTAYEILSKYASHCSHSGSPGVGDQFFVWARDNAAMLPTAVNAYHETRRYESFPEDPALEGFDWDDRVYVATAVAYGQGCSVVNAADSDYFAVREVLRAHVGVIELCEDELKTG